MSLLMNSILQEFGEESKYLSDVLCVGVDHSRIN